MTGLGVCGKKREFWKRKKGERVREEEKALVDFDLIFHSLGSAVSCLLSNPISESVQQ